MARILHLLTSPRAEGTPRLVLDWLATPGHQQGVAFLGENPPDLLQDFRRTGCWLRVGNAVVPGPRKFFEIARFSAEMVTDFEPDVVIAWPTGFSHWIFFGARWTGSRAALLSHGGNPPGTNWNDRYVRTWLCLWATTLCNGHLVACSRYVRDLFSGIPLVPSSRVHAVYNSLRAGEISRRALQQRDNAHAGANRRFRAIMVATLEPHKDHATLLAAVSLLKARGVSLEVWLVGAGSLAEALKSDVESRGISDTVTFLGARKDIPELLGQSDLFVFSTTLREGFGIVLFEALAAGLPVIASAVPPLCEVLLDGQWGTLVPPGDAAALAAALENAVTARESSPDSGEHRRQYAASFNPERMINGYLEIARL